MTAAEKSQHSDAKSSANRPLGFALVVVLAVLWWFLSGFMEPLILALGAVSIAITVYLAHRMHLIDREGLPVALLARAAPYWLWLGKEIVLANLDVAKRVIAPKADINPQIFITEANQPTELGQAIYANSITLTPGTVSLDLDPGVIEVHALSAEGMADILSGEMDRRCSIVDGKD